MITGCRCFSCSHDVHGKKQAIMYIWTMSAHYWYPEKIKSVIDWRRVCKRIEKHYWFASLDAWLATEDAWLASTQGKWKLNWWALKERRGRSHWTGWVKKVLNFDGNIFLHLKIWSYRPLSSNPAILGGIIFNCFNFYLYLIIWPTKGDSTFALKT